MAGEDLVGEETLVEEEAEVEAILAEEAASVVVVLVARHPKGHRLVRLVSTALDDRAIGSVVVTLVRHELQIATRYEAAVACISFVLHLYLVRTT